MRLDRFHFWLLPLLLTLASCAHQSQTPSLASAQRPNFDSAAKLTPDEIRSEVLSFADTYTTLTAQSLDELQKRTKRPQVAAWALQYKIATALGAMTDATSPNPIVSLLDMIIFVTLKRGGLEEHWIPTLLHDEGKDVLATFRRAESDIWDLANRALTTRQVAELRDLIDQWQKDNPTQYYVSHIRFTDFGESRHIYDRTGKPPAPGSLFALLFIDPMASMDPIARELRSYRLLTERMLFVVKRAPLILSWQLESAILDAAENPQTTRFLDSINTFNNHLKTFNDTTIAFATTLREYPKDLAREREALINEFLDGMTQQRKGMFDGLTAQRQALNESITAQRQGLTRDLESQHERIEKLLADARATLQDIRNTSAAVNSGASGTVTHAEESSTRLARRIFTYLLILLLALLIVGPIMLLLYRYASTRLAFLTTSPVHPVVKPAPASRL
jgi:hypothetical protein